MYVHAKLLLTSFEPFGGKTENASALAAASVPDRVGNFNIYKLTLPVVFGKCAAEAYSKAVSLGVDCVLSAGVAAGRKTVTPELLAVNYASAKTPDNEGNMPFDVPVIGGGREAYFSTLPARRMADAISAAGIPASLSLSAGSYVCNDLFYRLLRMLDGTGVRVGFIHVPAKGALSTADAAAALTAAISVIEP